MTGTLLAKMEGGNRVVATAATTTTATATATATILMEMTCTGTQVGRRPPPLQVVLDDDDDEAELPLRMCLFCLECLPHYIHHLFSVLLSLLLLNWLPVCLLLPTQHPTRLLYLSNTLWQYYGVCGLACPLGSTVIARCVIAILFSAS